MLGHRSARKAPRTISKIPKKRRMARVARTLRLILNEIASYSII